MSTIICLHTFIWFQVFLSNTNNLYRIIWFHVHIFFYFLSRGINIVNWITMTRKSAETPTHDIRKHWTAVSILLGLISSAHHNLHHWRLNQWPQIAMASLVCDVNWWLSCRVSVLQSVVTGSISSGGDYGMHCWWELIRSKQLSSVPVYRA